MTPAAADRVMARLAALWPLWKPTREQFDVWYAYLLSCHDEDAGAALTDLYASQEWRGEPLLPEFRSKVGLIASARIRRAEIAKQQAKYAEMEKPEYWARKADESQQDKELRA